MPRTRVKICCIKDKGEAETAIAFGADAIGLVGRMPSGPGVITDNTIAEIAAYAPAGVGTFLLTSETSAHGIVDHWKRTGTSTIQIVDYIGEGEYTKIHSEIPWVKLVQVIHVEDERAVGLAERLSGYVNALLLDSGRPGAETKVLGGTGKTHDWVISREIVRRSGVPVYLAGGITPENVESAIEYVGPFGIDVCTGVRVGGKLDTSKLAALFGEVRVTES